MTDDRGTTKPDETTGADEVPAQVGVVAPPQEPEAEATPATKVNMFISHREADKNIAAVLEKFFTNWGDGRVNVQSFTSEGRGLPIGKNLNRELLTRLADAEVLLLVYTTADEDWSYCMWEAGAAIDARKPDETHVLVLACSGELPKQFQSELGVDPTKLEDVQNLVTQFHASPEFFPIYGKPVSGHSAESDTVKERAGNLHTALQAELPGREKADSWPSFPLLILQLADADFETLKKLKRDDACHELGSLVTVVYCDKNFPRILRKQNLNDIRTLQELFDEWKAKCADISPGSDFEEDWYTTLVRQVWHAARNDLPLPEWWLMRSVDGGGRYLPLVLHVDIVPAEQCRRFKV